MNVVTYSRIDRFLVCNSISQSTSSINFFPLLNISSSHRAIYIQTKVPVKESQADSPKRKTNTVRQQLDPTDAKKVYQAFEDDFSQRLYYLNHIHSPTETTQIVENEMCWLIEELQLISREIIQMQNPQRQKNRKSKNQKLQEIKELRNQNKYLQRLIWKTRQFIAAQSSMSDLVAKGHFEKQFVQKINSNNQKKHYISISPPESNKLNDLLQWIKYLRNLKKQKYKRFKIITNDLKMTKNTKD